MEYKDSVLPIEIKSGKDCVRHLALNNVLANRDYNIPQAYVFSNGNVSVEDRVVYYPVCMISFLKHEFAMPAVPRIDISGL